MITGAFGKFGPKVWPFNDCWRSPEWLSSTVMSEVTHILSAIEQGDPHAAEQLLPLVYEELRKLAAQKLAHEKPGQTLQATALVHEAYLRLVAPASGEASAWRSPVLAATNGPEKLAKNATFRSVVRLCISH